MALTQQTQRVLDALKTGNAALKSAQKEVRCGVVWSVFTCSFVVALCVLESALHAVETEQHHTHNYTQHKKSCRSTTSSA